MFDPQALLLDLLCGEPEHIVTITADAGTSCNVPKRGFGVGYGSYRVDDGPIVRLTFGPGYSANAAEVLILLRAVQSLECDPATTDLTLASDSRIALRAAERPRKASFKGKASSPLFLQHSAELHAACSRFRSLTTRWHARENSVALFGH